MGKGSNSTKMSHTFFFWHPRIFLTGFTPNWWHSFLHVKQMLLSRSMYMCSAEFLFVLPFFSHIHQLPYCDPMLDDTLVSHQQRSHSSAVLLIRQCRHGSCRTDEHCTFLPPYPQWFFKEAWVSRKNWMMINVSMATNDHAGQEWRPWRLDFHPSRGPLETIRETLVLCILFMIDWLV